MKIAFATQDKDRVDAHFGWAKNIAIYEINAEGYRYLGTLYFSSNGHPGFGGLDNYVSRKQDDGTWGQALNLGYPINTGADENSLLVSADGKVAYFASDRPGGLGDLDLYGFDLYPEARPLPVSYIRGKVTDKTNGQPVEADVELYDLTTGKLATGAYSDPKTGAFLVCLPSGRSYALNAGAEGYLFYSENYDIAASAPKEPITLNVPLNPLTAGSTIALRNIFFNTASYELLPTSNAELENLVKLLKANLPCGSNWVGTRTMWGPMPRTSP